MADKVEFELVSPEALVESRQVDMVVVPGEEGDFGVLPGHAPFISQVRPGLIEIYDGQNVTDRLFVDGGFAEVTPERCTVLVQEAVPLGNLDRDMVDARIKAARLAIEDAQNDAERDAAAHRLKIAESMQEVLAAAL